MNKVLATNLRLKRFIIIPPLSAKIEEIPKSIDVRLSRHKVHKYLLYQIIHILVKDNLAIKSVMCLNGFTFITNFDGHEVQRILDQSC
jgi:hypothetical protein